MALNIENIVAELKEATILELNDLVKAIEEEFGVTAAAPVAVAAKGQYIKSVTLSATMGPGVPLNVFKLSNVTKEQ